MKSQYSNVCIEDSLYSLFLYMLIADETFIDSTFFFVDQKIPDSIVKNLSHIKKIIWPTSILGKIITAWKLRIVKWIKYPFLRTATIYGQDNSLMTAVLLGGRKMLAIEDGVMNYTLPKHRKYKLIKALIFGRLMYGDNMGRAASVKKIYLTGIGDIPQEVEDKTERIDIQELWNRSSSTKKKSIIHIFGVSEHDMERFANVESILFTQPLSEDHIVDESTKIELYKKILNNKSVVIKPHPRELTDYEKLFPEAIVLNKNVPVELLSLIGNNIKDVYTLFSTATLCFSQTATIHFTGTKIHPDLMKVCGDIRWIDGKVVRWG